MDLLDSLDFTAHVNDLREKWRVPGIAIGIFQDGVSRSKGYGKSSTAPNEEIDVDTHTVFEIASCSKSLTAAAVALLVADDEHYPQVQWNTLLVQLLPDDFAFADEEYTKGVTVEDIVSHRTGLPGHDLASMSPRASKPDTPRSIVRKLRHLGISAPIRSNWMYSNLLFTTAAYLVEHLTGDSFESFLRKRIWEPLGMKSTNLQSKTAIEKGLTVAVPYKWDEKQSTYRVVKMQYAPEAIGAGLVTTTADDYIQWVSALLTKKDPITQDVYDGLTKARSFEDVSDLPPLTSPELYSAGLGSSYYRGYEIIGHDGADPGVATTIFFMPKMKFACVIFTNATAGGNVHPILRHELVDAVLKVPQEERIDWATRERGLEDRYLEERKQKAKEKRKALSPETNGESSPQPGSLDRYVGRYWNDGYEELRVEIKDGKLFIDANDRTMGFTLSLEHLHGGTKYIAHMCDWFEGYRDEMEAEFTMQKEVPVKLGINLESDVEGQRIWFTRTRKESQLTQR